VSSGAISAHTQVRNGNETLNIDLGKLPGICADVFQKFLAEPGSRHRYLYSQKIYDAAGVSAEDYAGPTGLRLNARGRAKIQAMWSRALERGPGGPLQCDLPNFDVRSGSILKYAVKVQNFMLLPMAIQLWQVPLDAVDASDGRTLLDYVEAEMRRVKGTDTEQSLSTYRRMLINAGAKRCTELSRGVTGGCAIESKRDTRR
jgi:hypothetical protein